MTVPPRRRFLIGAAVVVVVAWGLALGGFHWARHTRPSAEGLGRFLQATPLGQLDDAARARALRRLAELLNGLPAEERQKARLQGLWQVWLAEMTEAEQLAFVESTAPTGFRQMLDAFERLEPGQRQRTIDDAMRRLGEARSAMAEAEASDGGAPPPGSGLAGPSPVLTDEARERVAKLGLKAYYAGSSARTKAELAPMLEELQEAMESGRLRPRGPRGPRGGRGAGEPIEPRP